MLNEIIYSEILRFASFNLQIIFYILYFNLLCC